MGVMRPLYGVWGSRSIVRLFTNLRQVKAWSIKPCWAHTVLQKWRECLTTPNHLLHLYATNNEIFKESYIGPLAAQSFYTTPQTVLKIPTTARSLGLFFFNHLQWSESKSDLITRLYFGVSWWGATDNKVIYKKQGFNNEDSFQHKMRGY